MKDKGDTNNQNPQRKFTSNKKAYRMPVNHQVSGVISPVIICLCTKISNCYLKPSH